MKGLIHNWVRVDRKMSTKTLDGKMIIRRQVQKLSNCYTNKKSSGELSLRGLFFRFPSSCISWEAEALFLILTFFYTNSIFASIAYFF